jgi:hypothetical protein
MKEKSVVGSKYALRASSLRTLLLCLSLAASSLAIDAWVVREDGVGPVKIGMTSAQISTTLHQKLSEDEYGTDNCHYAHATARDQISFMIIDGHLVRIDVEAPGIGTSTGIQVGAAEADVRRAYGSKVVVSAHQYVDTGHYLTVRSADGRRGVRFVTENGKVTMFYAGTYEAIQYVEGCE